MALIVSVFCCHVEYSKSVVVFGIPLLGTKQSAQRNPVAIFRTWEKTLSLIDVVDGTNSRSFIIKAGQQSHDHRLCLVTFSISVPMVLSLSDDAPCLMGLGTMTTCPARSTWRFIIPPWTTPTCVWSTWDHTIRLHCSLDHYLDY